MNAEPEETQEVAQARSAKSSPIALVGFVARILARLWIVMLLLGGAALGGVAVTQVFQKRAELDAARAEPGASVYAIIAYRTELERQIEAMGADRQAEAVPAPPSRPVLMEEIDMARARNETVVQPVRSESLGTISAPP